METRSLPQLKVKWLLMTIFFMFVLCGFNLQTLQAQQAATYSYTTQTGQSLDAMTGEVFLIGQDEDDDPSVITDIGFNFFFEGIEYTEFQVTPDGFLKFGTGAVAQFSNNMTNTTNIPKLCPWWDDVNTGENTGHVSTVLKNSAPNRIRIVEWFIRVPRNINANNSNSTVQVWLYETTNIIEFRYGNGNDGTSATVGIRGAVTSPASYISINTSNNNSSTSSANNNNDNWPSSGRMYRFTPPAPPACSGTPSPGGITSNKMFTCVGGSFTLSMVNPLYFSGLTYQWQSSPNNSTWTNIGGAVGSSYTTTFSTATWYRLRVACGGSSTTTSSIQIREIPCYCISNATSTADEEIFNVTLGTLNNTSNCNSVAPGAGSIKNLYSNYMGFVSIPNITQSQTHPISITAGQCGSTTYGDVISVFIDYNRNGSYTDAGELAFQSAVINISPGGTVVNGNFVVPSCASTGFTGMRVITHFDEPVPSPCGAYEYGETEDYVVNVVAATVVNPVATNISGPLTGTCNSNLTYTIATGFTGSIHWQSGTSASGPWTDISGATGATQVLSAPSPGNYFLRVRFTGQGCVSDVFSNVLTVVISNPTVTISHSTSSNNICRGTQVILTANGSGPYLWNTGATTQSITVAPLFSTTYSVTTGSGSCSGNGNITLNVVGGPFATAAATPSSLQCPGTPRNLTANLQTGIQDSQTETGGSVNINVLAPLFGITPSPYPSNLVISGLSAGYTIANVRINGFSHAFPADLDIALVAPNGSKVLLMADNGGGNSISGINLTFQDGAPSLPSTLVSGTFRTTTNTSWSGSGVSAPFATTLSSFSGSFNGTWKLYVYDDEIGDGGNISSWSITFNAPFQPFNFNGPVTYSWSGTNGFTSSQPNPADNPSATTTYTLTVADNTCSSSSQVTVLTHPEPVVSTFTGSPFCENGTIEFFSDGSGSTSTGTLGSLTVTISGPGFLDELSWEVRNNSNIVIASGGNYASGSTNNITVNPTALDYPVTFHIETQGTFDDNEADYTVTCSIGAAVLVTGNITGGNSFSSPSINCGSPAGNLLYSWSGPDAFTSSLEDPSIPVAQLAHNGNYTVTLTDGNGCIATSTTTVVVNENPEPFLAFTTPVSCDGFADGSFQIGVNGGTPFYSFNESFLGQNFNGFYSGVSAGTYFVEVTDINQCISQTQVQIDVETVPNIPPVISCPANITISNDPGLCGAVVNFVSPVGTDNCPVNATVQTSGLPSGAIYPIGTTLNTYEVSDVLGLTATCSFSVTVNDNIAPAITVAAANLTVECDGAGNTAALNAWLANNGGASATDECGTVNWSNNYNAVSTSCGSTGSVTVVFTATDANNNVSNTTATFTITDSTNPVITAAASQTVECDGAGNTAALNAWLASRGGATASDLCSGITWSDNYTGLSNTCGSTGSTSVTFTATDACGNASSTTASFTIVDTTDPVITSASSQTVECDGSGNTAALNAWLASHGGASASDICSGITWSHNFTSLSNQCGSTGSALVTFTATDACGNASTTSASFTIEDTTDPVVTAASNQSVECDGSGNTSALFAWLATHGGASASDNCSSVSWSHNYSGLSNLCGATGSATVTFIASDACGNESSTTATFTIEDNTSPGITAASSQTVQCDGAGNTTALNAWLASHGGATASDICSGVSWSHNFSGLSNTCGATGSATVVFTATDACGNASSTSAVFTIEDTTNPAITAAASQTVQCDGAGNTSALNAWLASHGGASASDNCSSVSWSDNYTGLSDLCGSTGSATVTFTATDDCGNASSTTASFVIEDNTNPSITAAANQIVECDGAGNVAELNSWLASHGGASASDICSGITWSDNYTGLSDLCGSTGTASVTFTATDECGNASATSATFTIEDNTGPSISCPGNITVNNDLNSCGAIVTYSASAADMCSGSTPVVYSIAPGSFFAIGTTTVDITSTDECGNISSCSFSVTVIDAQLPEITCAGNITTLNDPGLCGATETFSISISDNCPGASVHQVAGLPSGAVFPVGTTVNTFEVTDASGNVNTCSFSITVTDSELPTIANCPANFSSCNPITWTPPVITDNCPGVQINSSHVPGSNFPFGTTTVTYSATDVYNNVSTCSFDVTRLEESVSATSISSNRDYNNICLGESITLTIVGGSLGEQGSWRWYRGSCGGLPLPAFNGMTSITVSPLSTTTYYVRAEGLCNITACASVTVVVSTSAPGNISITSTPPFGATGVTGVVTCTPVAGATFYRWTSILGHINAVWFPSAPGPVETTVPSVNVLFNQSLQNYQIRVVAGNACGRSNNASAHIRGTVPAATCLNGPILACPNTSAIYSVASCPIPNTNSYQWTVGPGMTITSGQGTTTINVAFGPGFTSGQVCVNGITNFGLAGPQTCLNVSNNTSVPGAITGNIEPCQAAMESYFIAPVAGALSYVWSSNIVGAVASGTTTTGSIQFPSGPFSGQVCVQAVSSCGISASSCINVTSGVPGVPGPILGAISGICGATVNYALSTNDANSYNWILPAGVSLASPNGSNAVQVIFPSTPGSHVITVEALYDCGSATSSITVEGAPGAISVTPATICGGSDETYIASATGADSYNWTTTGAIYESCTNPSCSNFYVIWDAFGASFTIEAVNACGASPLYSLSQNCRVSDNGNMETKVYPNPTTGLVNVEFNSFTGGKYNLTVTDMTGRNIVNEDILASSGSNKHMLDLGMANPGLYMMYLKDDAGHISVIKVTVE